MNLFMAQAAEAGRRDIERPAGESGDEQVLLRRAEPVLDGYSLSCSHVTVRQASFHAAALTHAARRSEALQDLDLARDKAACRWRLPRRVGQDRAHRGSSTGLMRSAA